MFPSSCIYSRFVCGAHTVGTSPRDSAEDPGGRRPTPGPGLPDLPGPRAAQSDLTDRAHHRLRQDLRTAQGRRKYPHSTVAPLFNSHSAQYSEASVGRPFHAVQWCLCWTVASHNTVRSVQRHLYQRSLHWTVPSLWIQKWPDMSNFNVCMFTKERLPLNKVKHVCSVSNC